MGFSGNLSGAERVTLWSKSSGVIKLKDVGSQELVGLWGSRMLGRPGEMISSLSTDHKLKTGTNTKKALQAVYSMMSWAGDSPPEGWNRTRHVIILMTDGQTGSFSCPRLPPPIPACGHMSCVTLDLTCDPLEGGTLLVKALCNLLLSSAPQPAYPLIVAS